MKKVRFLLPVIVIIAVAVSCANSKSDSKLTPKLEPGPPPIAAPAVQDLSKYSKAYFASGCFWCVEAVYESVKGVKEAVSGYSGGTELNPTYEEVGSGSTGHAESLEVFYDSTEVSYQTLLKVYFGSQNPTQVRGQGPDNGKQYRSIIFYSNLKEKKDAEDYINELNASHKYKAAIAAQVVPFIKFWEAEGYHQNYVVNHPDENYVRYESIPRIKRFQEKYPELVKPDHKF